MINELLLLMSVFIIFGSVLLSFKIFGKSGLFAMTAVVTIAANIEVLILVQAFGIEQTLGNVLFASTFLITDILSECYGKKEAGKAVNIGIFISLFFIVVSQSWLLYVPSANDFVSPAIKTVFSNTPRLMLSSILVYVVCQKFDVWLYHRIWNYTEIKCGSTKRFLWVRNNLATLISQLLNTVLFNFAAFYKVYSSTTIVSIIISSYIIYIVTSIVDTPFVYAAREIHNCAQKKQS